MARIEGQDPVAKAGKVMPRRLPAWPAEFDVGGRGQNPEPDRQSAAADRDLQLQPADPRG
jgi:hypothetical protein